MGWVEQEHPTPWGPSRNVPMESPFGGFARSVTPHCATYISEHCDENSAKTFSCIIFSEQRCSSLENCGEISADSFPCILFSYRWCSFLGNCSEISGKRLSCTLFYMNICRAITGQWASLNWSIYEVNILKARNQHQCTYFPGQNLSPQQKLVSSQSLVTGTNQVKSTKRLESRDNHTAWEQDSSRDSSHWNSSCFLNTLSVCNSQSWVHRALFSPKLSRLTKFPAALPSSRPTPILTPRIGEER